MLQTIIKVLPVLLIFPLGYILKKINILQTKDADMMTKLVFYVSLPALVVVSVSKIKFAFDFIYLPLSSAIIIFCIYFISKRIAGLFGFDNATYGAFLTGTMIMNIGFVLPFVVAVYRHEGLARLTLFDFCNGLLTFTFTYFMAQKYGSNGKTMNRKTVIRKFLFAVPIWALLAGIGINFAGLTIPGIALQFLDNLGQMTIPLVMLSLGVYFNPRFRHARAVFTAVGIRMGLGFAIAFLLCYLFGIEGLSRAIVLIGGSAPVGYNTLVFSSIEKLNKDFAAEMISVSILAGILLIPLLMVVLK